MKQLLGSALRYVMPWLFQALPAWIILAEDRIAAEFTMVEEIWKVRVAAALISLVFLLATWVYFLRPWLRWDEPTGTWIRSFTFVRYCEKCRAKKIITPLKNEKTGWRCMVCERFYSDPTRRGPDPQPEKQRRDRI